MYYLYRIYLLLKFLLTCFNWIQHSVWQLWLLQSPHCQTQKTILKHTVVCTCIPWVHSLVHARTVGTTECGHSGIKWTPRRAPASRYIVAFGLIWLSCLATQFRFRVHNAILWKLSATEGRRWTTLLIGVCQDNGEQWLSQNLSLVR